MRIGDLTEALTTAIGSLFIAGFPVYTTCKSGLDA
jgi:hypothetical protein